MNVKLLGYRQGLRQPGLEVALKMNIPEVFDFKVIDNFNSEFLLAPKVENKLVSKELDSDAQCHYLDRLLQTIAGLQKIAGLPCFELGIVVNITRVIDESKFKITLSLPFIDNIGSRYINEIILSSEILVRQMTVQKDDNKNLEIIFKLIEEKIKRPIQGVTKSGVSTLPILQAAGQLNIPFRHLGGGVYHLGMGCRSRLISRSALDTDSSIGSDVSIKKDATAKILNMAGLPTPSHYLVKNVNEAVAAAEKLGFPVVVKPSDRERSEGVTIGIRNNNSLSDAYTIAAKLSKNILVEKQIPGLCFRLMIANKKFLYAVKRRPRSLIGDGISSIKLLFEEDLINNNNLPPWSRKKSIELNDETNQIIESQGFSLETILEKGAYVGLRTIESTEWGETTIDVTEVVSPDNIDIAERAANILRLDNAGIDIMTTDISKPWHEVGAIINEVNFRPHFGGTVAARSRMLQYVNQLMPENGRILVEVYVGDGFALEIGLQRQKELVSQGKQCFLTDHQTIYAPSGPLNLAPKNAGLFSRCQALLMNKDVEAILLVVQTDELVTLGLPVGLINKIEIVNRLLVSVVDATMPASITNISELEKLLNKYLA